MVKVGEHLENQRESTDFSDHPDVCKASNEETSPIGSWQSLRLCLTFLLFLTLSGLRYLGPPSVHNVLPLSSEHNFHNQEAKKRPEEQEQSLRKAERVKIPARRQAAVDLFIGSDTPGDIVVRQVVIVPTSPPDVVRSWINYVFPKPGLDMAIHKQQVGLVTMAL